MVNPEDKWKESAVLIYVVVTIITLTFFVIAFAWAIINNPTIRLRLKKLLCCCLHDSLNKYDEINQDEQEGQELIHQDQVKRDEEITYEIDDDDDAISLGEEIEINLEINGISNDAI
jgi:hypothetical protein